jgi:TPR repeat protein
MKRSSLLALLALLPLAVTSVAGFAVAQDKPSDKAKAAAKPTKGAAQAPATEAAPVDKCRDQIVAKRRAGEQPAIATAGNSTTVGKTSLPTAAADQEAAYAAYDQGKYLTALELARASAELGDPQAHTLVARIYDEGQGVAKDPITAARWYARAAELCDVPHAG